MDATNFVETISQLVPNKQDILRKTTCSEEFADIYIQDLSIKRKATQIQRQYNVKSHATFKMIIKRA